MSAPNHAPNTPHNALLEALFNVTPESVNTDLTQRVQLSPNETKWQPTRIPGLSVCILELLTGAFPRMSFLARVDSSAGGINIPAQELEVLVQHGIVVDDNSEYLHPHYLREPRVNEDDKAPAITLHAGSQSKSKQLEFYIATGQIAQTDTERRCINLADHSLWLPGPEEHIQVMPLHMHKSNNSMLVRFLEATSFRPRLDPKGEEVLVINGSLTDEHGTYTEGSWIRNPITSWQTWAGTAGTLIYYKNGHFNSAPFDADLKT